MLTTGAVADSSNCHVQINLLWRFQISRTGQSSSASMSKRGKGKVGVSITKPELPPFLQRMRQQIVDSEDSERRERSEKKRKDRVPRSVFEEGDPTVVKLDDDDLTEEEYKRMKKDLETQYKLDSDKPKSKPEELDIDELLKSREKSTREAKPSSSTPASSSKKESSKVSKKLSYNSSSDDED